MVRQIIIPTSNTYILNLPDELLGKEVEVLAFELQKEGVLVDFKTDELLIPKTISKASDIFNDCMVDLSKYKFNRDEANNYE
jgi:hypothetical protein